MLPLSIHHFVLAAEGWPSPTIGELVMEGGLGCIIILTLFLIGIFFAAWKAPAWVKEIGSGALVFSVFFFAKGLYNCFVAMAIATEGVFTLQLAGEGLRQNLICLLYGLIIYFISLVVRVALKPRI